MVKNKLSAKAREIRLVLTDCDGCLTDGSVYYGAEGEVLKRFHIRDGMAVELLRERAGVLTGIVTGEMSPSVVRRAEKLKISEVHLGAKDKRSVVLGIAARLDIAPEKIAYFGDDVNDLDVLEIVGLTACPSDAVECVRAKVDLVLEKNGGQGAFRELADFILTAQDKGF